MQDCPTTTATGVVVVVVVITELVGAGGGGAEITWDTGSVAQPDKRPNTAQQAKTGVSCPAKRVAVGAE